jgi:hypothetical protein
MQLNTRPTQVPACSHGPFRRLWKAADAACGSGDLIISLIQFDLLLESRDSEEGMGWGRLVPRRGGGLMYRCESRVWRSWIECEGVAGLYASYFWMCGSECGWWF